MTNDPITFTKLQKYVFKELTNYQFGHATQKEKMCT